MDVRTLSRTYTVQGREEEGDSENYKSSRDDEYFSNASIFRIIVQYLSFYLFTV